MEWEHSRVPKSEVNDTCTAFWNHAATVEELFARELVFKHLCDFTECTKREEREGATFNPFISKAGKKKCFLISNRTGKCQDSRSLPGPAARGPAPEGGAEGPSRVLPAGHWGSQHVGAGQPWGAPGPPGQPGGGRGLPVGHSMARNVQARTEQRDVHDSVYSGNILAIFSVDSYA